MYEERLLISVKYLWKTSFCNFIVFVGGLDIRIRPQILKNRGACFVSTQRVCRRGVL